MLLHVEELEVKWHAAMYTLLLLLFSFIFVV